MAVKKGINWLLIGVMTVGFVLIVSLLSVSDEIASVKHRDSDKLALPPRADHDTNENTIKTFTASNQALMNQTQDALIALEAAEHRIQDKTERFSFESQKYDAIVEQNKQQAQLISQLEQKIDQMNIQWTEQTTPENLADFGIDTQSLATQPALPDTPLEGAGTWISSDQLATAVSPEKNKTLNKASRSIDSPNLNTLDRSQQKTAVTPLYTIPYDAILYDAKALTA